MVAVHTPWVLQNGDTALMMAAGNSSAECVIMLLGVGSIDVNVQNKVSGVWLRATSDGELASASARWGSLDDSRALLRCVTRRRQHGRTALDGAREKGDASVVALLESATEAAAAAPVS